MLLLLVFKGKLIEKMFRGVQLLSKFALVLRRTLYGHPTLVTPLIVVIKCRCWSRFLKFTLVFKEIHATSKS